MWGCSLVWVLLYLGMVGRFCIDDPHFCDFQSDWVPILYPNHPIGPLFLQKNRFISITFSSRNPRTLKFVYFFTIMYYLTDFNASFTLNKGTDAVKHNKWKMANSPVVVVSQPSFVISPKASPCCLLTQIV